MPQLGDANVTNQMPSSNRVSSLYIATAAKLMYILHMYTQDIKFLRMRRLHVKHR